MIKPVGSICNLDCTYCYYLHKKELLGTGNHFRISDEILETHIRQYIEGQDRSEVVFSWQRTWSDCHFCQFQTVASRVSIPYA